MEWVSVWKKCIKDRKGGENTSGQAHFSYLNKASIPCEMCNIFQFRAENITPVKFDFHYFHRSRGRWRSGTISTPFKLIFHGEKNDALIFHRDMIGTVVFFTNRIEFGVVKYKISSLYRGGNGGVVFCGICQPLYRKKN